MESKLDIPAPATDDFMQLLLDQQTARIVEAYEQQLASQEPYYVAGKLLHEKVSRQMPYSFWAKFFQLTRFTEDTAFMTPFLKDADVEDIALTLKLGQHFKIILEAMQNDPFLQSEWDRFVIALRMRE